jgi:hypothetical protein
LHLLVAAGDRDWGSDEDLGPRRPPVLAAVLSESCRMRLLIPTLGCARLLRLVVVVLQMLTPVC